MTVLNTQQVKEILDNNPEAEFSLQPIRVEFKDGPGDIIAGYHLYEGHLPRMIHTKGDKIWEFVFKP